MVSVAEAERIILATAKDFGTEELRFDAALGRTLAQELLADRDFPPFNRATMDGIAIAFRDWQSGIRSFTIKGTQAAGDEPINIQNPGECIEIMTGAALPPTTDTVVNYEALELTHPTALIKDTIIQGQNIHLRGKDKRKGDLLVSTGRIIDPAIIGLAAATGSTTLLVKKFPRIAIISTGDELVAPDETPSPTQVRRSNDFTVAAVLQQQGLSTELIPVSDDPTLMRSVLTEALGRFDVVLLSGGVSMGRFDHVPALLEELDVQQLFHRVQQRPGKPFWFGQKPDGPTVFAFPGNPVSTFLCLHRYFLPWLRASLGLHEPKLFAILNEDLQFLPPLQYFLQVSITVSNEGQLLAKPVTGNGSGDFVNLVSADAFMELPAEENNFTRGSAFRIWSFASFPGLKQTT
jgi:molybdopterin molybdotransferase